MTMQRTQRKLHFLGPLGSFTHAAAVENRARFEERFGAKFTLVSHRTAAEVFSAVSHTDDYGLLAFENNVEGYVVPNLDSLIDADDVVGVDRVGLPVAFDAFILPRHAELREVAAHPHGLAQCKNFVEKAGYTEVPATSNAEACQHLTEHRVGLGPRICGELYGLETLERNVQDYQGARTDFLLLSGRDNAQKYLVQARSGGVSRFETVLAFVPLSTGPGVLANALDIMRDSGLNMTSFISRPIKGHDGTYSFIATFDAAPWQKRFVAAVTTLLERGDWVRSLAVYERPEHVSPPVETWMLPTGGVRDARAPQANRELLWGE